MSERFPGYDVLAKRHTPSWNEKTRQVIDERLALPREPRYLSQEEWLVLEAICERIVPQPRARARYRSQRWSTQSSSKTAATAIAIMGCHRCVKHGGAGFARSMRRRGAGTM